MNALLRVEILTLHCRDAPSGRDEEGELRTLEKVARDIEAGRLAVPASTAIRRASQHLDVCAIWHDRFELEHGFFASGAWGPSWHKTWENVGFSVG